jgi:hypothetical protein
LKETENATVKEAKYFSDCKYRSKVVMELVSGLSGWVETSFIVKTLLNVVKEHEYEFLASKDLTEFGRLMWLMTPDTRPEFAVTQKFLRIALDEMIKIPSFSCEKFFYDNVDVEDEVEDKAKEIAEKYYDNIIKDYDNNKVGTIKRATNELAREFNYFRPFDEYELQVIIQHGILWNERDPSLGGTLKID